MNTLIAKLARASARVGALKTDKTNTAQNYSYISADKILERAGDALAAEGIVVVPSITGESIQEVTYTDNYSKTKTRHDATVTFSMLITDGKGELKADWTGRGSDFSVPDKALYKAITSGHKYFLTKLLNIGVGNEDGEHDEEAVAKPQAKPQPQAQRPQQPPADAPRGERLAEATHKRLHALGHEAYGDRWDDVRHRAVVKVSKGAITSSNDLTEDEARTLIAGIEKKLADATEQKFDAPTPEARGARPAASAAMRQRVQGQPA